MRKKFVLPNISFNDQTEDSNGIVVVAIIGKSALNTNGLKVKSLGRMFSSSDHHKSESTIEGFYDEEKRTIYLHAFTLMDTNCFLEHYENLVEKNKETNFLSIYDQVKSSFAKTMLILFHVSHIVVLSHPGSTFDVNFIQYFKAVDSLRQKLLSDISDSLKNIESVSDEWILNGRMCTPRLLFYFEQSPKNVTNLKKLEHNTEDKIYQILKKTRIVNNCTSLFAIPLNQEFVFMSTEGSNDRLGNAVRSLIQSCQPGATLIIEPPFCVQIDNGKKSFSRFLQVHIQQAKEKGFDDIVASMRLISFQPCHFELPKLHVWVQVCKTIYALVTNDSEKLVQNLCTDTRFSEQRCEKVFPIAIARYQEGLPSHYSRGVHETRLGIALNLFAAQARGPKFEEYRAKIVGNCKTYWENSRQLCESPSLTGNPCTLPKHNDELEHNSGVRYIAACDCGRIQRPREDPYTTVLANHVFFKQASKECACSGLDRIEFEMKDKNLEFETELKQREVSSAMLTTISPRSFVPDFSSWSLVCLGPSSLYSHNLGLLEAHQPGFLNSTNYLLPWDVVVYSKPKPIISLDQHLDPQKFLLRQKRIRTNNTRVPQFTVKVFIGVEYECPRGHRFMLAAPDRVLRATPGSIVKDTGHKITESDMPLYYPCPCRPTKPLTAQLMRLHVVTPKASVYVTVNPRVQPAAGSPIFIATEDGPTALTQSTYWVMRLPFIYSTDKENFTENHSGRLLQGVFAVNKIEQ
ncbi:nonsense-mediated mRNA decay factor SMG8 [Onthophagus taurus]|uniref:nonsense-mediated mRNA decay factor SMG8 n=1 Tax=Onthophagus taurus TaxID=166361 RepID=UPI000C202741|nr:protein SMG8 [Onthophagus taurus]